MDSFICGGILAVEKSKKAIAGKLIFCAAMCAVMVYVRLFYDFGGVTVIRAGRFKMLFLVGAISSFAAFVFIFIHALNGKPLFLANKDGFVDNSGPASAGVFIPWEDICEIYIGEAAGIRFIEMKHSDTERYLQSLPPIKRKNAEGNMSAGREAVCINLDGASLQPEDLLPDIISLWKGSSGGENLNED